MQNFVGRRVLPHSRHQVLDVRHLFRGTAFVRREPVRCFADSCSALSAQPCKPGQSICEASGPADRPEQPQNLATSWRLWRGVALRIAQNSQTSCQQADVVAPFSSDPERLYIVANLFNFFCSCLEDFKFIFQCDTFLTTYDVSFSQFLISKVTFFLFICWFLPFKLERTFFKFIINFVLTHHVFPNLHIILVILISWLLIGNQPTNFSSGIRENVIYIKKCNPDSSNFMPKFFHLIVFQVFPL